MKIVIDIDDDLYVRLFDNGGNNVMDMRRACVAIRKGITIPKGHGDLKEYLTDEAIDIAIKAIEQSRWIPVSEGLPKDEQEVQITYKISGNKYYVWSAIWGELHGRFYDKEYRSYISLDYVTAWKPLSEPYKVESEEHDADSD